MACWRVLELDSAGLDVPPLLIKPTFESTKYTVFLTDLSNIWSEELELVGIVERASELESPIEVSKQDTTQLAILLQNLEKSLADADDTIRRMTRGNGESIYLHTSTSLPEPLDSLSWRFRLEKRTSTILKNELILPLLVASHIQHQRVSSLTTLVHDKDKAITRLLDQYESSHLDLASAFPSVGGNKPGRRIIKREQAARHIPALQPFQENVWMKETGQLQDPQLCTLGLFQEALSECNPKVPDNMEASDKDHSWWTSVENTLDRPMKPGKLRKRAKSPVKVPVSDETLQSETEDEFETHENFKLQSPHKPGPSQAKQVGQLQQTAIADSTTDDDADLDEPMALHSRSHRQDRATSMALPTRGGLQEPAHLPASQQASSSPVPSPQPRATSITPASRPKAKGFKIGGRATRGVAESPLDVVTSKDEEMPDVPMPKPSTPTRRKAFKIGGKNKSPIQNMDRSTALTSPTREHTPPPAPSVRPLPLEETLVKGQDDEEHEETPEERAERKRRELKRKNDELAKKQAQKKKKRF